MAPVLLRALSSTLLAGAVLHCAAADAGEPKVEPETIITIPGKGLDADEQKIVWLGPSKSLRVVDATNAAVFLPQVKGEAQEEDSSSNAGEMNKVAYLFQNGACDFSKTVEYKSLFPQSQEPLWVRTAQEQPTDAGDPLPSSVANYTFINPPAKELNGVSSFCVRFMVKRPLQSHSAPSAAPDTTLGDMDHSSSESHSDRGVGAGHVPSEPPKEQEPELELTGDESPQGQAEESGNSGGSSPILPADSRAAARPQTDKAEQENEEIPQVPQVENSGPSGSKIENSTPSKTHPENSAQKGDKEEPSSNNKGDVPRHVLPGSDPANIQKSEGDAHHDSAAELEVSAPKDPEEKDKIHEPDVQDPSRGASAGKQARLRRLSEPTVSQNKYLTIIVHSAAGSAVGRVGAASAALLAATAWLLPMF
ncbi:Toxoplasma gondii family A protein [Besnoitia besnoiti]|uniref:Toxoplasma gondii family A protein n=1 Tax=Besnoitia besnoiti TaxID=94643 RepID=A0A2A9MHR7_BESBE|nr:Toxoplasma gondii family A protein [Besnoitia besnoiti]PFH36734.1 Toxoplasma gondii family A protein [Besnoitia besnoiti]